MRPLLLTGITGALLALGCKSTGEGGSQVAPPLPPPAPASAPAGGGARPGINDTFLDPDLDIDQMLGRFEVESREIFSERKAIAAAVGIQAGQVVADVGAGTGLFLELFADAVGPDGKLYAVDISERMVEHMTSRAQEAGWEQVDVRLCGRDAVDLPEASIDLAFICDVYHHFEYPKSSMASIHKALRYGGEVVIVDFERIPGVTRDWLMNHVRAGKSEVIAEMNSFGFDLLEENSDLDLPENYFVRFKKR